MTVGGALFDGDLSACVHGASCSRENPASVPVPLKRM